MKILVVIDMQNDFTSGALGNAECEKAVSKVVDVINENNYECRCYSIKISAIT